MCQVVYLTSRSFSGAGKRFRQQLASELRHRRVEVREATTCPVLRFFRRHQTYGIAIALDFFRDGRGGSSLTLNQHCSHLSRDLAYNISNAMDRVRPRIYWRSFRFVDSHDRVWSQFFSKVSSETKAIFYLCDCRNEVDYDCFTSVEERVVCAFADEIVRCLRSGYDYGEYSRRVRLLKRRARQGREKTIEQSREKTEVEEAKEHVMVE